VQGCKRDFAVGILLGSGSLNFLMADSVEGPDETLRLAVRLFTPLAWRLFSSAVSPTNRRGVRSSRVPS
jgi:hypothetical protein